MELQTSERAEGEVKKTKQNSKASASKIEP